MLIIDISPHCRSFSALLAGSKNDDSGMFGNLTREEAELLDVNEQIEVQYGATIIRAMHQT